ncbi:MAG: M50 family metallopeptidase [Dehalococcoidales bacterium]|nr:M50 family metallopeptidase [Dehalococcoidales bacterium]
MFVSILAAIGAFLVLIIAHELGHFFAAKLSGVKVEEFGIFLPPRLLSFKKGETVYSLNAIPFGAFNKLSGEEDPQAPRSLASKSRRVRFFVLSAGALMNLLLPFFLLTISFLIPHAEATDTVVVAQVLDSSPAATAGIVVGDIILKVNGNPITQATDYSTIVKAAAGAPVTVTLQTADGSVKDVVVTPRTVFTAQEGATGISIQNATKKVHYPIWKAIPMGAQRYWDFVLIYKDGIVQTVRGTIPFELSGPVGIVAESGKAAQMGFGALLQFTSIISFVLGISNLLPLPALDGGRIVFVLLEWVRRGKRVSPKTEGIIHGVGFVLLLALLVVISYKDILRLIHGG